MFEKLKIDHIFEDMTTYGKRLKRFCRENEWRQEIEESMELYMANNERRWKDAVKRDFEADIGIV